MWLAYVPENSPPLWGCLMRSYPSGHVQSYSRRDGWLGVRRRAIGPAIYALRLTLLAPALAASSAWADMPAQVTLRATSALPDDVIRTIAELAIPEKLTIPAAQQPEDVLRTYCGSLTNTYIEQLLKLNPDLMLVKSPTDREIKAPACAKWSRDTKVTVLEGDTINSVIEREIGLKSGSILKPCAVGEQSSRCGKSLYQMTASSNPGMNLQNLQPGTTLTLPNVTFATTLKIDPTKWRDAADAITAIKKSLDESTPAGTAAPALAVRPADTGIKLVGPVKLSSAEPTSCNGSNGTDPQRWPFDTAALSAALIRTVPIAKATLNQVLTPSVINVVDTGVTNLLQDYPPQMLAKNGREIPANAIDDEKNTYIDDVYGINTRRTGDIEPDQDYEFWHHGTDVAALASGRRLLTLYADIGDLVRIRPVNVVQEVTSASDGTGSRQFEIPDGSLIESVRFVASKGEIANLSIESSLPLDSIVDIAKSSKNFVLIVAAGNGSAPLGDSAKTTFYPAVYGGEGELRDQAITVAAHDGDNHLTTFSNKGARYVDIAAPGCALSSGNANAPYLDGTSFAAPLVSFTVAIMKAFGLSNPKEIKDRLYAASDYVPDLKDTVRSSGVLNIAKSIALFDDVAQVESRPGLIYGAWSTDPSVLLCQGQQPVDPGDVRKITKLPPVTGDATIQIRILTVDARGNLTPSECIAAPGGLQFKEAGSDAVTTIGWSDFQDLVPSFYPN
jgi:hypothetical protein